MNQNNKIYPRLSVVIITAILVIVGMLNYNTVRLSLSTDVVFGGFLTYCYIAIIFAISMLCLTNIYYLYVDIDKLRKELTYDYNELYIEIRFPTESKDYVYNKVNVIERKLKDVLPYNSSLQITLQQTIENKKEDYEEQ